MLSFARSAAPVDVTPLLREALASARSGDTARSHKLFRQVTVLDPSNEAAWLWFANTASDPAEAARGLRAALQLNPNNAAATGALPQALLRAGVAAAKAKDRERAAQLLADATALDPRNEAAWLWRAGVCDVPETALEYLERVLKINPNNVQAREGAAKLRLQISPAFLCPICDHRTGAEDTLADECPQCRAIVSLNRPELFDRPSADIDHERVKAAARRLKGAWSATAKPAAAYGLGLALLNLGYPDEAIRALETAVHATGADPDWNAGVTRLIEYRRRPAHAPAPARTTVMIVDDSATVRVMVSSVLTGAGYHVIAAPSADEASRLIHSGSIPQLFILDVNMPGTDGFGLCKGLRAHPETASIPVVFLTGKTGLLNKLHGRWVGAAEYLTKPFQNEKLLDTVARLTAAART